MLEQRIDGGQNGAGDLVATAQQPVGEGQQLAPGRATQRGKHHGTANEEEALPTFW